jgi:predicted GIY-YIG superfamily endonuclease
MPPMINPVWYSFNGTLPDFAGVYLVVDRDNNPIYVGETDDFDRRIREHRSDRLHPMHHYAPVGVWVELQAIDTVRAEREAVLLAAYLPPANG